MRVVLRKPVILRFWVWYYTGAGKSLLHIWKNFIIFVQKYYFISLLLRTLIAPWRRDITRRPCGLNIKNFLRFLVLI